VARPTELRRGFGIRDSGLGIWGDRVDGQRSCNRRAVLVSLQYVSGFSRTSSSLRHREFLDRAPAIGVREGVAPDGLADKGEHRPACVDQKPQYMSGSIPFSAPSMVNSIL